MILCIKLSVLSIIHMKSHEKTNSVPNHSSNKIWNILVSECFGWSAHISLNKVFFDEMLISTNVF